MCYNPIAKITSMKYRIILIVFYLLAFLSVFVPKTQAVTSPTFPSCTNPSGIIKSEYSQGIHGIAGKTDEYSGSDSVYTLTEGTHTQCFCAEDGDGIQTNWWKVSSLSEDEIKVLKSEGWVYIPNGALWGYENEPYMAKNSDYACQGGPRIGGVEAGFGEVLGLASTGNIVLVYAVGAIGLIAIILSLLIGRNRKPHSKPLKS